ncbi:hypothetical protein JTE90_016477 [Oedothorax gibbosus]|uniref:Uncharacterized protein n=1 Tax=Oedothorax gibbosus TaxID=931172 RepID=A0AAV6V701_9ARAC|nr:hypothetical protein JTE90_016477 [Oedothorax gibbosus]
MSGCSICGMYEPEGLQEIFDLYSTSGILGFGSGLTKENFKKWMEAAGLTDGQTGCSERDLDEAFEEAVGGKKTLDFRGFKEILIKNLCTKKREPKEYFDKLVGAMAPTDLKK